MCEGHLRAVRCGGKTQAAERREQRKRRFDRLEIKPFIHLVVLDLHDRGNGAAKAHQGLFKPRPVAKWASGEESDLRSPDPQSNVGEVGRKTKHLADRPVDDDSSRGLDHDDRLPSPGTPHGAESGSPPPSGVEAPLGTAFRRPHAPRAWRLDSAGMDDCSRRPIHCPRACTDATDSFSPPSIPRDRDRNHGLNKDYVLVLLFVKYVSDKYAGQPDALIDVPSGGSFADMTALKGDIEIGDKMNKIVAKLAEANELKGVIDVADFNDPEKLGRGKEMQDRLSNLIAIFENSALDFRQNCAEGNDLLGDAYEYLMRHFATESGKSKEQFYTPAEVSRTMAKVIGINKAKSQTQTIYDPTCGSGSLLLKAAE
jgi:hypothetical protein